MSGSTNSKIKDQNKQVEKQYDYDKDVYNYTNYVNEKKYENAVLNTQLKQADLDALSKYKNQTNKQNYLFNKELQAYQFDNEKKAYKQALKDYDKQVEFNSMAGALAQSAEDTKLDEALIAKNFALDEQDLLLDQAKSDKNKGIKALENKVSFAEEQLALDTDKYDKKYVKKKYNKDIEKLEAQATQLENDLTYLSDTETLEIAKIDQVFQKAKTTNFQNRIESLVKMKQAIGSARASGREGNSAVASVDSILAKYGREQSALVDSLVFATTDQDQSTQGVELNIGNQTEQKELAQALNTFEQEAAEQKKDFDLKGINLKNSKLELAFDELKEKADLDTKKLKADFGFKKEGIQQSKDKINTSFDSAKQAYKQSSQQIELEEYGANLAAKGKIPQKPTPPPALPKPYKLPKTNLPMPMEPIPGPKPIKGALGKTSIWNDVGDGLNVALQIGSLFI